MNHGFEVLVLFTFANIRRVCCSITCDHFASLLSPVPRRHPIISYLFFWTSRMFPAFLTCGRKAPVGFVFLTSTLYFLACLGDRLLKSSRTGCLPAFYSILFMCLEHIDPCQTPESTLQLSYTNPKGSKPLT